MFELIKEITRPSADIEFFSIVNCKDIPPEALNYFSDTYKKTGKRLSSVRSLSDDKLKETVVEVWDSRDSYLEYLCDAFVEDNINAYGREYSIKYGIEYKIISAKEI